MESQGRNETREIHRWSVSLVLRKVHCRKVVSEKHHYSLRTMGTCIEKQRKGNNNRANVAFNFQRQIVLAQRHGQVKVLIERTRGA